MYHSPLLVGPIRRHLREFSVEKFLREFFIQKGNRLQRRQHRQLRQLRQLQHPLHPRHPGHHQEQVQVSTAQVKQLLP